MKVLLLGGGGFLSSAVEERLAASGHAVTVLSRSGRSAHPGSRPRRGDRGDAATLHALATEGFGAVVDFLCFTGADAALAVDAFGGRVERHIMISTGSVYWCTGEWSNPVGEDQYPRDAVPERAPTPLTPGSVEYAYGVGKRAAEDELAAAAARQRFVSLRLRFPVVGGAGDPTGRYDGYRQRIADGGPLVLPDGGHNSFRHLFVHDAAAAVEAAATGDAVGGGYNVASREIVSVRDVVRLLGEILGRPQPQVVDIPADWLRREGFEGLFAPFSARRDQILDIQRARSQLGFAPTPYKDWLAHVVAAAEEPARGAGTGQERPRWRPRRDEIEAARRFAAAHGPTPAAAPAGRSGA